ncbi:hypothetical protein ACJ41O_007219 [Fusarium nematophilum]
MFFKTIAIALLAASSAVFASPLQQVEERQVNPSVELCSNKGFNDCDVVNFHFGVCQAAGRLNDKVSSLKANGHNCIFFK